jgi:hypothetical protein
MSHLLQNSQFSLPNSHFHTIFESKIDPGTEFHPKNHQKTTPNAPYQRLQEVERTKTAHLGILRCVHVSSTPLNSQFSLPNSHFYTIFEPIFGPDTEFRPKNTSNPPQTHPISACRKSNPPLPKQSAAWALARCARRSESRSSIKPVRARVTWGGIDRK